MPASLRTSNRLATREDVEVAGLIKRLFWDHRGPHAMYALSSVATGGPPSSWTGDVNDPNDPLVVLKWLEASAKGCLALLREWHKLLERIEQGLGWQSHDRLKAIRMLGRQPTDAAEDKRIVQIYVGAFAIKPSIKRKAYDDLKAEMATLDFKAFVNRVRDRWPMVVDASEMTKAREMRGRGSEDESKLGRLVDGGLEELATICVWLQRLDVGGYNWVAYRSLTNLPCRLDGHAGLICRPPITRHEE